MRRITQLLPLLAAFGIAGCRQKESFPELGLKLAGPAASAMSDDGTHFYILNTDFERTYDTGSLLVVDEDGNKVTAVKTPRLGRMMTAAGNDLFIGYEKENPEDDDALLELYDITDPKNPQLKQSWRNDCVPLGVGMRKGYNNFAVTCSNGRLYVGEFKEDRSQTVLHFVRDYGQLRRGIYLDPVRELLFVFTSDYGRPTASDMSGQTDAVTADEVGTLQPNSGPNDVPDYMEDGRTAVRKYESFRQTYQFVVYDFAKEREEQFPFRTLDDPKDKTARQELRWLYFTLKNVDGTPDSDDYYRNPNQKTYRTNIWHAEADPLDPNAFYISQRGSGKDGGYANNIVRVTFTGDIRVGADGKPPLTGNVLDFKRVYGFGGEVTSTSYPGDFTVRLIQGQPLLMVNHFRDLVYWKSDNRVFSLVGKVLGQDYWRSSLETTDYHSSYCDVSMNERGIGVSPSYYGASAVRFKFVPNVGFIKDEVKRIE